MKIRLAVFAAFALLGAACGGDEPVSAVDLPAVDSLGQELFEERVIGSNPGCITCHSLEEGVTIVGPSLFNVTSPITGMSDREYIYESIADPDGYIASGFSVGQMSRNWTDHLTEAQIESLVDFLLTHPGSI